MKAATGGREGHRDATVQKGQAVCESSATEGSVRQSAFVATYLVTVKKIGAPTEALKLGAFMQGGSVPDVIRQQLAAMSKEAQAIEGDAYFVRLGGDVLEQGPWTYGLLEAGDFGRRSTLFHVDTREERERSHREADCLPHYYRFYLPPDGHAGLVVLQKHGSSGIVTQLRQLLSTAFIAKFPDYRLSIAPRVPRQLLETLKDGAISEIELQGYRLPSDIADMQLGGLKVSNGYKVKVTIAAPRREFLGLSQPPEFFTLPAEFGVDEKKLTVSVKVPYRGSLRKLNFQRNEAISPSIDITDDVTFVDGHPTFESIDTFCASLLEEMVETLDYSEQ